MYRCILNWGTNAAFPVSRDAEALRSRARPASSRHALRSAPQSLRVAANHQRDNHVQIDLNCDLGEGCPYDAELMPLITSANVACGFHAGDPSIALTALRLADQHKVRVGAHPSFPDRESFGRQE